MALKSLGVRVYWSIPDEDEAQTPTWDYPGLTLTRPYLKAKFTALPATTLIGVPMEYISMHELFPNWVPEGSATINHTLATLSRDFSDPKSETFGRPSITEDACKGHFWFRRADGMVSLDRGTLILMEFFINAKTDRWMRIAPRYQEKVNANQNLLAQLNLKEFRSCCSHFIATYGSPEKI